MAAIKPIMVGDQVRLRGVKDMPIGYVTYNTVDHFCVLCKDGYTYNMSRAQANPIKTGKRFDIEAILREMS